MALNSDEGRTSPGQIVAWTILGALVGIVVTSTYWVFSSISELKERQGVLETLTLRNREDIRQMFDSHRRR